MRTVDRITPNVIILFMIYVNSYSTFIHRNTIQEGCRTFQVWNASCETRAVLSQLHRILDRDRRIFHFSPITHPPNRFNWSFQLAFFTDTHSVDRKKFNEVASTRRCESTYKVGALSETAVVTGYRVLSFRFLSGPVRNLFRTISRKATPAIESRREHK